MDKLLELLGTKAEQYLNALEEISKQFAPEAVEAAILVVQLNAINELIFSAVSVLYAWLFMKYCSQKVINAWREMGSEGWAIGGAVAGFVGFVLLICSLVTILNVWTWVALFNPKLYIARQILGRVF